MLACFELEATTRVGDFRYKLLYRTCVLMYRTCVFFRFCFLHVFERSVRSIGTHTITTNTVPRNILTRFTEVELLSLLHPPATHTVDRNGLDEEKGSLCGWWDSFVRCFTYFCCLCYFLCACRSSNTNYLQYLNLAITAGGPQHTRLCARAMI